MSEQKMEYFQDFSKEINYSYKNYNNYQSWSNKGKGEIKLSNIIFAVEIIYRSGGPKWL